MPLLPRTSLAAFVCPSTPFLVPRLLRTPVPLAALNTQCSTAQTSAPRATYATQTKQTKQTKQKPKGKGKLSGRNAWKLRRAGELQHADAGMRESATLLQQFRDSCDARSIDTLMDLYPTLATANLLDAGDTRRIAQALHAFIRNIYLSGGKQEDHFLFVQRLVQDIQSGVLPPHPLAHVHLLGVYKECKKYREGAQFWQWLSEQDDTYLNPAVFGAAIELLAYLGQTPLPVMEELYMDALKRFPGTFAEYHLSPEAVIPDRTQATNIKGLPMLLLQGITTARLINGDWKQAYLALDTALRLYPAQVPPRFFELFMAERPVSEAYTVFLIACRSGVALKPHHLTTLISKLRKAMTTCPKMEHRMLILQGIANAIYAYLEAGGTVHGIHWGSFLESFDAVLPFLPLGKDFESQQAVFRNQLVATAHKIVSSLIQAGLPTSERLFTGLIHLAGSLRVPDLLTATLRDVEAAQLDIGPIGRRSIITAAGYLADTETIERIWSQLTAHAETVGEPIGYQDWITVARACGRAGHEEYFRTQLETFRHAASGLVQERALSELSEPTVVLASSPRPFFLMDDQKFERRVEKIQQIMLNIATVVMSSQPLELRKTPFYMFLDPARPNTADIKDLQSVYNEFTTDPHQPLPPPPPPGSYFKPPLCSTGFKLSELRFQNWVDIIELMSDAEATEVGFKSRIDQAIAAGARVEQAPPDLNLANRVRTLDVDELRSRIKRLRSPKTPPSVINKVAADTPRYEPGVSYRPVWPAESLGPKPDWGSVTKKLFPVSPAAVTPSLSYYFALKPTHDAPVPDESPPPISRRPLGSPKSPNHHEFRAQRNAQAQEQPGEVQDGSIVEPSDEVTPVQQ
ncbi:hypothetical protein BDV95DRAFT_600620 [Massariosphaeria phaeospora]|uniref:Uncharacterized protein n=1 Tax=Massariosphaeria phaeospora TaxID=100035 RepID=A0A7C8MY93_9PLEO|nr:hypothetical protein BDV95DRAFT_600620 [Massariosphaeria phaeospora]